MRVHLVSAAVHSTTPLFIIKHPLSKIIKLKAYLRNRLTDGVQCKEQLPNTCFKRLPFSFPELKYSCIFTQIMFHDTFLRLIAQTGSAWWSGLFELVSLFSHSPRRSSVEHMLVWEPLCIKYQMIRDQTVSCQDGSLMCDCWWHSSSRKKRGVSYRRGNKCNDDSRGQKQKLNHTSRSKSGRSVGWPWNYSL